VAGGSTAAPLCISSLCSVLAPAELCTLAIGLQAAAQERRCSRALARSSRALPLAAREPRCSRALARAGTRILLLGARRCAGMHASHACLACVPACDARRRSRVRVGVAERAQPALARTLQHASCPGRRLRQLRPKPPPSREARASSVAPPAPRPRGRRRRWRTCSIQSRGRVEGR
jgi:hypothetical protein